MSNISERKELLFKKNKGKDVLSTYIKEIEALVKGVDDIKGHLLSIEETDSLLKMRKEKAKMYLADVKTVRVLFADKAQIVKNIISRMETTGVKTVFIYMDYSQYCGLFRLENIGKVNPDFSFNTEHAGLVSIISEDLNNRILFDFYEMEEAILEIEVSGPDWTSVVNWGR